MYQGSWKFQMEECGVRIDKESGRLLERRGGLERERMKNGLTIEMDVQAVLCVYL